MEAKTERMQVAQLVWLTTQALQAIRSAMDYHDKDERSPGDCAGWICAYELILEGAKARMRSR